MDSVAVSRALSHGVGLRVKTELRFPSGPNGEYLPSYSVVVGCEISGNPDGRDAAISDLENLLTPAPELMIEEWLAELDVVTVSRQRYGFEASLMVTAYISRLRQFPADVVRSTLLDRTWKFFPSWDELEKACRAMTSPRLAMLAALRRGPVPEREFRQATAEERARIQAMVDEMFPGVPDEMRSDAVDEVLRGNCMAVDATPSGPRP